MYKSKKLAKLRSIQAKRQGWRCFYCSFQMWNGDLALPSERYSLPAGLIERFRCTAEHLRPQRNGGKDSLDNVVAACKYCNNNRHKMRDVLSPAAYQQHVRKRVKARKWHPLECHHLLK